MMNVPALRECPFCGETGRLSCEYLEVRGYWTVSCADCGSTGPTEMSRRAAVLGWNGRAVTNLADQPQAGAEPGEDLRR